MNDFKGFLFLFFCVASKMIILFVCDRLGPAGPEQVSRHLNSYFGKLIQVVNEHGGDVLKFAGNVRSVAVYFSLTS